MLAGSGSLSGSRNVLKVFSFYHFTHRNIADVWPALNRT